MQPQPDEEVPRLLARAERELATGPAKWLSWATIVMAVAAGWTLLLPWSFGRRIGLTVWRLGFAEHPLLCVVWAAGTAAAVGAAVLQRSAGPKRNAVLAAAGSGAAALMFTGWAWGSDTTGPAAESWTGPGPAVAGITGLLWLLAALGQILASRQPGPPLFTNYEIREATGRLRRTRRQRPTGDIRLHPDL